MIDNEHHVLDITLLSSAVVMCSTGKAILIKIVLHFRRSWVGVRACHLHKLGILGPVFAETMFYRLQMLHLLT